MSFLSQAERPERGTTHTPTLSDVDSVHEGSVRSRGGSQRGVTPSQSGTTVNYMTTTTTTSSGPSVGTTKTVVPASSAPSSPRVDPKKSVVTETHTVEVHSNAPSRPASRYSTVPSQSNREPMSPQSDVRSSRFPSESRSFRTGGSKEAKGGGGSGAKNAGDPRTPGQRRQLDANGNLLVGDEVGVSSQYADIHRQMFTVQSLLKTRGDMLDITEARLKTHPPPGAHSTVDDADTHPKADPWVHRTALSPRRLPPERGGQHRSEAGNIHNTMCEDELSLAGSLAGSPADVGPVGREMGTALERRGSHPSFPSTKEPVEGPPSRRFSHVAGSQRRSQPRFEALPSDTEALRAAEREIMALREENARLKASTPPPARSGERRSSGIPKMPAKTAAEKEYDQRMQNAAFAAPPPPLTQQQAHHPHPHHHHPQHPLPVEVEPYIPAVYDDTQFLLDEPSVIQHHPPSYLPLGLGVEDYISAIPPLPQPAAPLHPSHVYGDPPAPPSSMVPMFPDAVDDLFVPNVVAQSQSNYRLNKVSRVSPPPPPPPLSQGLLQGQVPGVMPAPPPVPLAMHASSRRSSSRGVPSAFAAVAADPGAAAAALAAEADALEAELAAQQAARASAAAAAVAAELAAPLAPLPPAAAVPPAPLPVVTHLPLAVTSLTSLSESIGHRSGSATPASQQSRGTSRPTPGDPGKGNAALPNGSPRSMVYARGPTMFAKRSASGRSVNDFVSEYRRITGKSAPSTQDSVSRNQGYGY